MLDLTLQRFPSTKEWTLGGAFDGDSMVCFTVEDQAQPPGVVVPHETRIPAGRYRLELRREGPMHEKYSSDPRVSDIHQGMLWLQDVPGRTWIYVHLGNDDDDTDGCIIAGDEATIAGRVRESLPAYRRLYLRCTMAMARGEQVFVTVRD